MNWGAALAVVVVLLAVTTAAHAVLHRRDSRAAVLWVGLVWLSPIIGAVLYALFGINRVRRRARRIWTDCPTFTSDRPDPLPDGPTLDLSAQHAHLGSLRALVDRVVERPLLGGNRIEPLVNGDAAYPAMLRAIDEAQASVSLASYIFGRDKIGLRFVASLAAAVQRGVTVRVLVDDAGARYSFPTIWQSLADRGVTAAPFYPRSRFFVKATLNMRNHRKICVVDGHRAFTGGMNIQAAQVIAEAPRRPILDVHFSVLGPVVQQLQEVFAEDWLFATGESLAGEAWFPRPEAAGPVFARTISDGPDTDLDKLRWAVLGAIGAARDSIKIVTPYFLPDPTIVAALNVAVLRGVAVDIVLPRRPNIRLVGWAVLGTLWQVLEHGCRVWFSPRPFDHSKLMLVDGAWTLLGSANWDPRSFRLNFELNLECYDEALAAAVDAIIEDKRRQAVPVTADELAARSLPVRLRDGVARLFSPML